MRFLPLMAAQLLMLQQQLSCLAFSPSRITPSTAGSSSWGVVSPQWMASTTTSAVTTTTTTSSSSNSKKSPKQPTSFNRRNSPASPYFQNVPSDVRTASAAAAAATTTNTNANARAERPTDMNVSLIRSICLSQLGLWGIVLAGAVGLSGTADILTNTASSMLLFSSGTSSTSSSFAFPDWSQFVTVGFFGTAPLIAMHNVWESRRTRATTQVDLATNDLVASLFGRRCRRKYRFGTDVTEHTTERPTTTSMDALMHCTLLTVCTSVAEETIYRLLVPLALVSWWGGVTAAPTLTALLAATAVSSVVFAAAHTSPGHASPGETALVASQQTLNGLWYSGVNWICAALATTGSAAVLAGSGPPLTLAGMVSWILPSILVHTIYDLHVLQKAWHTLNDQMDWVEQSHNIAPEQVELLRQLDISRESLLLLRRMFYAFDHRQQGMLTTDDVQRAVTYCLPERTPRQVELAIAKQQQQYDTNNKNNDNNNIDLSTFVRILLDLRQQQQSNGGREWAI